MFLHRERKKEKQRRKYGKGKRKVAKKLKLENIAYKLHKDKDRIIDEHIL